MTTPRLDETDKQILRALQCDGRVSYADLGPTVGLSAPAARARVQRLIDTGVVRVVGVTDPIALGLPTMAMLGIRADGDIRTTADAISACEGVMYVVLTAGAFDLFVEVVCHTPAELLTLVNDRIKPVPGVTHVETFTYFGIHTPRFVRDVP
ncbi:MAG TPA: Lrp/AsnC family transcriptional regulator [Actinospica sp.]|nr:Lrp/AsnC family transcriptional regulator [Actinospica sp.]HWG26860.1 Lrp/AsnC family transcriptional regulator [Actinospica sp.]